MPEWASRHHLELVNDVVDDALEAAGATLDDAELIAVTQGPGLVGALLVGVATAKGLAAARRLPLAAVDHLQGHVAANFLEDGFEPPFICLLASGGHTLLARVTDHHGYETLGQTLDDAAGEAFDKGARMLGLGYPGGPALSKLAATGDPTHVQLSDRGTGRWPRLLVRRPEDRAAVQGARPRAGGDRAAKADLAASYEHAIVEALIARVERALAEEAEPRLAIGGGVAANRLLRERALAARRARARPAACAVHRQRRDDRLRGPLREPAPYPDYLALDAYATRRAA